jgi:hypothetical protein
MDWANAMGLARRELNLPTNRYLCGSAQRPMYPLGQDNRYRALHSASTIEPCRNLEPMSSTRKHSRKKRSEWLTRKVAIPLWRAGRCTAGSTSGITAQALISR